MHVLTFFPGWHPDYPLLEMFYDNEHHAHLIGDMNEVREKTNSLSFP